MLLQAPAAPSPAALAADPLVAALGADEALSLLPEFLASCIEATEGHALWRGPTTTVNGADTYGRLILDGRTTYVHRLVYEIVNDSDREPRRLTQTCDVALCVLHWAEQRPGPRTIRRATEILFLEEFIAFCEMRLRQIRKRRLVRGPRPTTQPNPQGRQPTEGTTISDRRRLDRRDP